MTTTRRARRARLALSSVLALALASLAPALGAGSASASASASAEPATVMTGAERRGMPNVWWYDAMTLDKVHRIATGKGVKVAVIDGYLDPTVPDLRGAKISKGTGCRGKPTPYLSGEIASHGTAMTTAIVGQGAGGKGIVGVAPDAELRFFSFDTDPKQSLVECDAILIRNQIEKAVQWGADVISMSIGTGLGLEDSIKEAWKSGAVVVAASGATDPNESRGSSAMEIPAEMAGVVAVAAADSSGKVWKYNPYSADYLDDYLTVTAPGVEVPLGGFPAGSDQWLAGGVRTGTSPATAITSGAFAVLRSRWPEATNNQLIQAVIHSASGEDQKGKLFYDKVKGYGLIKLLGTLDQDPSGWPDENPLLLPPPQAMKKYPVSVYEDPGSSDGSAGDTTTEDDGTQAQGDTAASDAQKSDIDEGGVPAWAFVVGALVLAGLLAAGLLLGRRARRPAASDHQDTSGTTADHTAPRGS